MLRIVRSSSMCINCQMAKAWNDMTRLSILRTGLLEKSRLKPLSKSRGSRQKTNIRSEIVNCIIPTFWGRRARNAYFLWCSQTFIKNSAGYIFLWYILDRGRTTLESYLFFELNASLSIVLTTLSGLRPQLREMLGIWVLAIKGENTSAPYRDIIILLLKDWRTTGNYRVVVTARVGNRQLGSARCVTKICGFNQTKKS